MYFHWPDFTQPVASPLTSSSLPPVDTPAVNDTDRNSSAVERAEPEETDKRLQTHYDALTNEQQRFLREQLHIDAASVERYDGPNGTYFEFPGKSVSVSVVRITDDGQSVEVADFTAAPNEAQLP